MLVAHSEYKAKYISMSIYPFFCRRPFIFRTESDVKGKSVFALRIKGDSMEPEFREGDVVIVNPHVEAKPGDYVVVKNDEEEATFKQLKKFGDTLVLHPLNSKYEDIELKKGVKYRIVGKVVKKEKRY